MENVMDKFDNPSKKKVENQPQDSVTMVHTNRKVPPPEGGNSQKICGTWTMKYDISSQKLYELLIKTKLKGDIAIDLDNFSNHIKMCLNVVAILRDDILPA